MWQVQPTECQPNSLSKPENTTAQKAQSRNIVAARRFGEVTKSPTHWEDGKSRVNSFA